MCEEKENWPIYLARENSAKKKRTKKPKQLAWSVKKHSGF